MNLHALSPGRLRLLIKYGSDEVIAGLARVELESRGRSILAEQQLRPTTITPNEKSNGVHAGVVNGTQTSSLYTTPAAPSKDGGFDR